MAIQTGNYTITGTSDDLCFYKMEGKHYVRRKSSLNRKRVLHDAAFVKTRYYAQLLGKASGIASLFYKKIAKEKREKGLYKQLTGIVMQLLQQGKAEDAIITALEQLFLPQPVTDAGFDDGSTDARHAYADALLAMIFAEPVDCAAAALKDFGFV